MWRGVSFPVVWKLALIALTGYLVWLWTEPRSYYTKWNFTYISRSHLVYERVLKTKLHLENEIRLRRRHFRTNQVPTGEPIRGQDNIIFIETSCLINYTINSQIHNLNSRQACSIESAAKMNPLSDIYLLHSCPMSYSTASGAVKQLFTYSNIRLWHLNMRVLVCGTPLEDWDYEAAFRSSSWPLEHSSDVIRFLALWKYGGTYLDLDIVVTKSLDLLEPNFVCEETLDMVGSSVLRLDFQNVGHLLADLCILGLAVDFRGDIWAHNGPELITRNLKEICRVDQVELMSPELCMGVVVHTRRLFFPVPYWSWQDLFNTSGSEATIWKIRDSFGVHMWNKLSQRERIIKGSTQPYSLIAQKFCPKQRRTRRIIISGDFLKDSEYRNSPHTIEELKNAITAAMARVMNNFSRRL